MKMLRAARKSKGLTMKELGEKVGVSESAISQYETGKREADFETILKIGEVLDCSIDYLLRGAEQKKEPAPESGNGLSETARQIMECVNRMSQKEQETFLAWLQASQGRG